MPTILKTKNSVTTTVVPTTLQQGELAVNITDKKMWVGNAATTPVQLLGGGVTGDVVGPASATDNAISRFDGTTGKLIQNSLVTVSDTGAISAPVDASISGLTVGKGAGSQATNTVVGNGALAANTSGSSNSALGINALAANLGGSSNSAFGVNSLQTNTSGDSNSAYGVASLRFNTTGVNNTALGTSALQANTTASNNTAVGYQAGYSNTTGANNLFLGRYAGYSSTTSADNAFVGQAAAYFNTTGQYNVALGSNALYSNTTAAFNTAVGYQAGYSNSTGSPNTYVGAYAGYGNTTGGANAAFGYVALYNNSTGQYNTAIGRSALEANTTASYNTALGYQAGYSSTTNGFNTCVGQGAGYLTTGSVNTFLGSAAGSQVTTGSKNTILGPFSGNNGGLDIRTASNQIVLSDGDGNPRGWFNNSGVFFVNTSTGQQNTEGFAVTNTGGGSVVIRIQRSGENNAYIGSSTAQPFQIYDSGINQRFVVTSAGSCQNSTGSYGTISDAKLKENIVDATPKLDKVMQLKVKNFTLKTNPDLKQIGFIAQELREIFPSMVEENEDENKDGEKTGEVTLGIKTTVLIPILVKAIQELKAEVDSLKQQLGK